MLSDFKKIAVIAPSGPPHRETLLKSVEAARRANINIELMPNVFAADDAPYLAASTAKRLDDLHRALNDPDTELILCARGGFGAVHLLDGIDWQLMRERNLPLAGLSDITALHLAMLAKNAGIPWAAPMAIRLERLLNDREAERLLLPLFHPDQSCSLAHIEVLRGDEVQGLPVVANLTVMASLCGSEYMPDVSGRVLVLEDVGEAPYRLDRSLMQLALNGIFSRAAGVVFGTFTDCGEADDAGKLIDRSLALLPEFVGKGMPFGHDWPITAIDQSRAVKIVSGELFTLPR